MNKRILFLVSTLLGVLAFAQSAFACGGWVYQPETPEEILNKNKG